jgi:hypothetical protein
MTTNPLNHPGTAFDAIMTVADSLYDFEYGESPAGHKTVNDELRPLFDELNAAYSYWESWSVGIGDHSPIQALENYRKVFKQFEQASKIMGLWQDFPETFKMVKVTRRAIKDLTRDPERVGLLNLAGKL